jgi:hypothetical protein
MSVSKVENHREFQEIPSLAPFNKDNFFFFFFLNRFVFPTLENFRGLQLFLGSKAPRCSKYRTGIILSVRGS